MHVIHSHNDTHTQTHTWTAKALEHKSIHTQTRFVTVTRWYIDAHHWGCASNTIPPEDAASANNKQPFRLFFLFLNLPDFSLSLYLYLSLHRTKHSITPRDRSWASCRPRRTMANRLRAERRIRTSPVSSWRPLGSWTSSVSIRTIDMYVITYVFVWLPFFRFFIDTPPQRMKSNIVFKN